MSFPSAQQFIAGFGAVRPGATRPNPGKVCGRGDESVEKGRNGRFLRAKWGLHRSWGQRRFQLAGRLQSATGSRRTTSIADVDAPRIADYLDLRQLTFQPVDQLQEARVRLARVEAQELDSSVVAHIEVGRHG